MGLNGLNFLANEMFEEPEICCRVEAGQMPRRSLESLYPVLYTARRKMSLNDSSWVLDVEGDTQRFRMILYDSK